MIRKLRPFSDIRPLPPFPAARFRSNLVGEPLFIEPETWTDFAPLIAVVAAATIASGDLAATPLLDAPPHPAILAASDAETARIATRDSIELSLAPHSDALSPGSMPRPPRDRHDRIRPPGCLRRASASATTGSPGSGRDS